MTRRGFFGLLIGAVVTPRLFAVKTQGKYKLVKGYSFIAADTTRYLHSDQSDRLHVWEVRPEHQWRAELSFLERRHPDRWRRDGRLHAWDGVARKAVVPATKAISVEV